MSQKTFVSTIQTPVKVDWGGPHLGPVSEKGKETPEIKSYGSKGNNNNNKTPQLGCPSSPMELERNGR